MEIFAPVADYIKKSILTTLNDILVMGATQPERLGQGSLNQVLTISDPSYRPAWRNAHFSLKTIIISKGDMITHSGLVPERLIIGGSNYMILTSYGGSPTWQNASNTLLGLLTNQGDIIKRGAALVERLGLGAALQFLRVNAGATDVEYATPYWIENALLTTQGDIIKRGVVAPARLAKGAANQVLTVNAAGTDLEYKDHVALPLGSEYKGSNAGLVTLTGSYVTIKTLDIGTFDVGAKIRIDVYVETYKGGTAGNTTVRLKKDSGTGVIEFFDGMTQVLARQSCVINEEWNVLMSVIGQITTAGTIVLLIEGISSGSDTTVAVNAGQLYALVLKE